MGDDRFNRGDRKKAYEYYMKAADLLQAVENFDIAADALFQAAECLQHNYHILSEQLSEKISEVNILQEVKHSDHCPIKVVIK